jgi:DNA gyrase subunit A
LISFTTAGMVYTLKCWRLPLGARNARGKAIVNILPIPQGVSIAAIMPIDVPEEEWASLQVMFATSDGDVRRNALDDFTNVKTNGKIAMKLPEGVRLINARICSEGDDVMLTTKAGRAIRFRATDVRVFKGRDSTGVRGIRLGSADEVVSMAVIRHFEATPGEREAYLKMRRAVAGAPEEEVETDEEEEVAEAGYVDQARYDEMSEAEDLLLTAMDRAMRGGPLVALFPVEQDAQIMLATDAGQSIRVPVADISFRSRSAGGVRVFNTASDERVVSVAPIAENGEEEEV